MSPKKDAILCRAISKKISELRAFRYPGHGGQSKCAKAFGIGVTTWNGWEAGRNIPSDAYQRQLAEFFGISIAELRGEQAGASSNENASSNEDEAERTTKLFSTLADIHRMLGDIGLAVTKSGADAEDALQGVEAAREIVRRVRDKQLKEGKQKRSG